jgi:hypothetical protein
VNELGVAGTIATKFIFGAGETVEDEVNNWLNEHADVEIIDIRYSPTTDTDHDYENVMIIYRKED